MLEKSIPLSYCEEMGKRLLSFPLMDLGRAHTKEDSLSIDLLLRRLAIVLTFAKYNFGRFADINTSPTLSPSPSTSYQTPVIDTLNILSNVSNTSRKRLPKQQALTHLQPSKPFEPPIAPSITQMHIFLPYQTPQHKCSPQIHPRHTFITHTSTQSNTSEPCENPTPPYSPA